MIRPQIQNLFNYLLKWPTVPDLHEELTNSGPVIELSIQVDRSTVFLTKNDICKEIVILDINSEPFLDKIFILLTEHEKDAAEKVIQKIYKVKSGEYEIKQAKFLVELGKLK